MWRDIPRSRYALDVEFISIFHFTAGMLDPGMPTNHIMRSQAIMSGLISLEGVPTSIIQLELLSYISELVLTYIFKNITSILLFLLLLLIAYCIEHAIDLLILPPHTWHMLQPLDVSVFSPLKARASS